MLSRVAERVYWMARYVERAESSARLVNAYTTQVMDLPRGVEPGWKHLVDITGANALFEERHPAYDERSTIEFLVADAANPGSILTSLAHARENVRTTRDVLPTEAWEYANELYLYARSALDQAVGRKNRFAVLKTVILRCQQIAGLLASAMSHDVAYDFVRIGRSLERADMTTRIVDSAVFMLLPRKEAPGEYDSILWMNVLKSLSAFQMYRQHVRNRVVGDEVVRFLWTNRPFPRSVAHTLSTSRACLAELPRSAAVVARVAALQERVDTAELATMSLDDLHRLIDVVQSDLNAIHEAIRTTWFEAASEPQRQSQAQDA